MNEPAAAIIAEKGELPIERSPQRLLREVAVLAAILMVVLGLSLLESYGFIPGEGYGSSLILLILCWRYAVGFSVAMPLRSSRPRGNWLPVLVVIGLSGTLCAAAAMFLMSDVRYGPSLFQAVHLVVLVPLSEEFYFRGILFEHLRRGLKTWQAVVFCTLLFGLLHRPSEGVITAMALSLVTCGLVLWPGGLAYAIAVHAAWNALTVIVYLDDVTMRWAWAIGTSMAVYGILFFPCGEMGDKPRRSGTDAA